MYDVLTSLLSEELLTQAVRVDGVLYLPAYGLFEEVLTLVGPFFMFSLMLSGFCLLGDCLFWVLRRIIAFVKNKKSQG